MAKENKKRLTYYQLKTVLNYLFDGNQDTLRFLLFCRNFRQEHEIYNWLFVNKIKGAKLVEFFAERGSLQACNDIINRIKNNRYIIEKVNAGDLQ